VLTAVRDVEALGHLHVLVGDLQRTERCETDDRARRQLVLHRRLGLVDHRHRDRLGRGIAAHTAARGPLRRLGQERREHVPVRDVGRIDRVQRWPGRELAVAAAGLAADVRALGTLCGHEVAARAARERCAGATDVCWKLQASSVHDIDDDAEHDGPEEQERQHGGTLTGALARV
jgi:hypothetical protein